ncbi:MAG TPA: MFS transporter [Acidobacteriota bacterium]|nr:MFS transporter [Acidobacteriota bacterium]
MATVPLSSQEIRERRRNQRNALIASFLGWMLDAFDFFVVVMVLTEIAKDFKKTNADIALTLSVTLAFRPVGAFLFGLMADRYGRRIPLMVDVVFYSVVEIASGFAPTYTTFIILRALFGIGMGGEWGVGASLAMEAVPPRWRGILSGVLQEGYAVGYLLASCAYFFVLPHFGWRAMFFIGGLPALLAWFIRRKVKESEVWEKSRRKDWSALWTGLRTHTRRYPVIAVAAAVIDYALVRARAPFWFLTTVGETQMSAGSTLLRGLTIFAVVMIVLFMSDITWRMAEGHRRLFFYLVALMAMMNFVSHGTQDMYPTFLKVHRGLSPQITALVSIVANIGALIGGICVGLFSDRFGRRRGMVISLLLAVIMIPFWAYAPTTSLLILGAFLMQFMVQGAWGVIPAHITELSPDSVRGFLPGFAYQCGVLIAGTVAWLEAIFARRMNYANAMAVTALTVFLVCAVVVSLGREKRGIEFGK